MIWRFR